MGDVLHPRYVIDESKLTEQEIKVLDHLGSAWNEFLKLPQQHPDDREEFIHHLHICQRTIGIRGVRIMNGESYEG